MKIQIREGSVSPGDASEFHLVTNHLIDPTKNIDRVIMYAEQRYLMTLLVSGVRSSRYSQPGLTPSGGDAITTKIKPIPEAELVSSNAWAYKIMGRIQKACEILGTAAVGTPIPATTSKGSTFKLYLKDNYLTNGMNAVFYNGEQARVMGTPITVAGKHLYTFESYPGKNFVWATWIGAASGIKTCFGGYTTFGERSLRGYGVFHYPDTFLQHTTKQRKSISLSGDVNANRVIWYEINNEKGFVYEAEAQSRAQFLLEDDFQKLWGISTMRDAYGNLLAAASMVQPETGEPIVAGDGWFRQIEGANDLEASGADGLATWDDHGDMLAAVKKKKNTVGGNVFFAMTGSDGMAAAHNQALSHGSTYYRLTQNLGANAGVGGGNDAIGYNFQTLNIHGQQVVFVENPQMDDEAKWPRKLSNGKLAMSCTYFYFDMAAVGPGRNNIEVRARGREGVNRNIVYHWEEGMTGEGKPNSPVDARAFHMLKENMIVVYNSKTNGYLYPPLTA